MRRFIEPQRVGWIQALPMAVLRPAAELMLLVGTVVGISAGVLLAK
jgi:hypothetical protein